MLSHGSRTNRPTISRPALGLALMIALTASGCGNYGSAIRPRNTSSTQAHKSGVNAGSITYEDGTMGGVGGTQSGATDGGTTTPTTTTPTGGTEPTLSFQAGGTGYSTQTFTVAVNKILKVQFTPGVANQTVSGTGFTPQYSKLAVFVMVGGSDRPTALLSNGVDGSPTQSSAILDFSSSFTRACGSNTTCRQNVTITVSKPNNDYWCYNYGMYCDHTHVYQSHPWNGTLMVQTDDTVAL